MKVVITGSSGLIGTALTASLRADGHDVVRLVRRAPSAPDERQWDPSGHRLDPAHLDGADAVVHLAGIGVGDKRWTPAYKREIVASRVDGTTTIAQTIAGLTDKPRVLVSASAVGYYGDRGDDVLDESEPAGSDFLARACVDWEAATAPAADAGVRVSLLRTGLVLSPKGGVLGRTLPLFRYGAGARLGDGRQWMPWIALEDEVAAIRWIIDSDSLGGPVALSAPNPVRNRDYTRILAHAVNRPAVAFAPRFALRLAIGEFTDEGLLVSQRQLPQRLTDSGFTFCHTELGEALDSML